MKKKTKRPYRTDCKAALDEIDARRIRLGIKIDELCREANVKSVTWWRMRKSGLGFSRRVRALRFALRTIEQRRRAEAETFPRGDA